MKPPFTLVRPLANRETVDLLEELLKLAKKGEILGLATIAMYKRRKYEFATTGEATRSPTFTLGAVSKLQLDVAMRVNRESDL